MRHWKLPTTTLILVLSVFVTHAKWQSDFSSGAIKTDYGFLLVWNAPNNYYTIEIKGNNVRQISSQRVQFNVDGMFLQILNAPVKDFLEDAVRQKVDDRGILEAHRDWEMKFMETEYKEKLKVESSWQKLSNGKEALAWQFDVPASARSNVTKQVSLTLVKGNHVLMLGGITTATIEERATRKLLLDTAESLKVSSEPIDLRKQQDLIRKQSASVTTQDKSKEKTSTLRGTVYRTDKAHPVANAVIVLLDEKRSGTDNSVETRTDAQGNFSFAQVVEGSYTVSIRTWYEKREDAPCQLLLARTKDKDSTLMVAKDKDKFVEQVFIKGFSIKAGKEIGKDFDITCKSLSGG